MKKILTIIAISLICFSAQAEVHLEAGTGASNISGNIPATDARIGACLGLGHNIGIGKTLILDPMLQLSLQGKDTYGILYAKLPVILYVKAANFDIGVGPYAAYGIWNEYHRPGDTISNYYSRYFLTYPDFEYAFDYFKCFDAGVMLKIRYNFSRFYLGLEESLGLLNIGRFIPQQGFDPLNLNGHTISFNALVGVRF